MDELKQLGEKQSDSQEIYNGKILHVFKDTVILPGGHKATRELIRHVGAVGVLPIDDEGNAYVERQYRYPIDKVITEIPAGKLDSKAEDPFEAAKRELREETGLTADSWTVLGTFYPSAAYTDEKLVLYLARSLHQGERQLDDDEYLNVFKMPFPELVEQVMAGLIPDSKTQIAVLKANNLLKSHD